MLKDWQIIQYANQLREAISFNYVDPIISIDQVITDAGYIYIEEHFKNEFSGFSKYVGPGKYVIGFNKDHFWSEKFRRFTLAHELGHLTILAHRSILDRDILHRSRPEFNSGDEIEIEADKFAINFLAPKQTFLTKSKFKGFNSKIINMLSDYFNISTFAAALHFIDTTDLSCVLIVNNNNGNIVFERRSKKFNEGFYHPYLHKQKIPDGTYCFDFLNGFSNETILEKDYEIDLDSWYPNIKNNIKATESLIELGYNNFILSLIEPYVSSDEEE